MAKTPKGCDPEPIDPEPIDPEDPNDPPLPLPGLTQEQRAEVQQMINESMPGWGTDGTWLVFIYASWWWLLECPEESPGIEIAAGVPFWRALMNQQEPPLAVASKLGCQRVIRKQFQDGRWVSTELHRQADGSWL